VASETNMAGRNISATVIMINIPAHNPKKLYVLYEKQQYSAGEQTENHDFVKPILSDSLPPSQEPNMDPIPKATMIHPTSA
jgi:hypothetical protein